MDEPNSRLFPSSAVDRWPVPPDVSKRRVRPEWMDDPRLDPSEHRCALTGLARLNRLGRAASLLWPHIERELERSAGKRIHVLDVACGSGDVLRELHRRARGRIFATGIDVSEEAIANAKHPVTSGLEFRVMDALSDHADLPVADVVMCSLFLHHLEEEQIVELLKRMARAARRRIVVSDLERSRVSWTLVWFASRLVTGSRVVHHDSARSVEAAWRVGEIESLANQAGLIHVRVARVVPCRLLMTARPGRKMKNDTSHE